MYKQYTDKALLSQHYVIQTVPLSLLAYQNNTQSCQFVDCLVKIIAVITLVV